MFTLRLTQTTEGQDKYHVEVALEAESVPRRIASARFDFKLTAQEQEDLRWYVEDFLEHPYDPTPKIAVRVEREMQAIGTRLFNAVFMANKDTDKLWNKVLDELDTTDLEVATDVIGATELPWELLFDPYTNNYLALQAHTFVRTHATSTRIPTILQASAPIRILLVVCRPGGREDVPFRSVAVRIIKGLSASARRAFQLDVLRPPTFERLAEVLRAVKARGQPYHAVHFDGHGTFLDMEELFEEWRDKTFEEMMKRLAELVHLDPHRFSPEAIYPRPRRPGGRGYLAFENRESEYNLRLVDGPEMGALLKETDVPVLVLNACLSAHAEAPHAPEPVEADTHTQVRAYGSMAHEVIDEGVAGVVAMRHNVYVVTAAQFVADLYASLAQGHTLGEAVTLGRKQLAAKPWRTIAYDPLPLQDWPVPVVYEATPIALFPKPAKEARLAITLEAGDATPERGTLDPSLPPSPDAGFYGRDETLLALDRAFDTQPIVLLHAYAGSGKTATAAEFARWYALTGGVEGPVLFTSFEQYKPLARVLDQIEQMFGPALEQAGIHWLALDDDARRQVALQVMQQIPLLWIWDNVEPVAGFPAGTDSAWSATEQRELVDFLRAARETRAKFLLASRRDERAWLGDLPRRITIPPMPMQERVQLARALAEKHGRKLTDVEDWRPLLRFTRGNPLTITVLVGQALRDGLTTKEQIEAFVARLRAGETAFEDEESEGRAKSLGASLRYGFEHAFNEDERRQLALLHFFQGFVNVQVLQTMGHPEAEWCLPEVHGLTREDGMALLDRAAEVGLLTAHGGGYYSIHPALPWYFKSLFDEYYAPTLTPPPTSGEGLSSPLPGLGEGPGERAVRAFVEAMGELGSYYHREYEGGNRDVIAPLTAEEANLLHARQLARRHGWWRHVISTMQGLRHLYAHTGRRAEWGRLVEEIVPNFVDPTTEGPLPGLEEEWNRVIEYRVWLAEEARQWTEAQRLHRARVDWNRQRAASVFDVPLETLDAVRRNYIRELAASLHELGEIQRELGQAECVAAYEETATLMQRIGDQTAEATAAFNLGHAYLTLPAIRDLAQAERRYRRSLELRDERDRQGRAQCVGQLGLVAYEEFKDAQAANKPEEELLRHLNAAVGFCHQALDLLPPNAVDDLAVAHNQLGIIYHDAGDLDRALSHYRESIRYEEMQGNLYGAAETRRNVALTLAQAGRLADAREYAQAALRNFQTYGDRAVEDIQKTQGLIADIEEAIERTSM
jgi:tetratricopeptide (TPR) repeat protein